MQVRKFTFAKGCTSSRRGPRMRSVVEETTWAFLKNSVLVARWREAMVKYSNRSSRVDITVSTIRDSQGLPVHLNNRVTTRVDTRGICCKSCHCHFPHQKCKYYLCGASSARRGRAHVSITCYL
ncbi:hypothetical protein M404DRAFT_548567 [Pisolithus tinctorius Marx 270]|uniref:Uncharacterized protein n=1 Tax=Pisolithus tinctorius Marx 270 TaxID=870435 RepID=A0A0C3J5W3_PISTI|nr:hypothetical protein M404DRAFT_548567 [Pisolithus tinctorius Marx 270]